MKVRQGFVSNSSSSSFVIYGAWVKEEDIKNALDEKAREEIEEDSYMIQEYMYDLPMYVHFDYEDRDVAFGRGFSSIKDDETGKEFKESVEKSLEETFGKKIKCDTIHHTYYC
jgi:hypothetical protein